MCSCSIYRRTTTTGTWKAVISHRITSCLGISTRSVQESIDKFAEQLRTLDTFAPGVFNRFMDLANIEQESTIPDSEEMYNKLIASNEEVIAGLTELFMMLEENHLHGFGDFIAGRIDAHNKHQWMLKSTLK
jgi:starvation-inducible DNA-binding protein